MNSWKIGSFRPHWGLVLDEGLKIAFKRRSSRKWALEK